MLVVRLKKTDYDTKISDIEKKITDHDHNNYITTPEFNTMTANVFNTRLAQANVITKTDFDAKLSGLNKMITSNKVKHLLVENELKKLEKFDAVYFRGKNYFEEDGTQNYLVFQPMSKYFEKIASTKSIAKWKSKELFNEVIKPPDNTLLSEVEFTGKRMYVKFRGGCLEQDKVTFNHGKIGNIYTVYDLQSNLNNFGPALGDCLFGAVIITKNADVDKYKYSGYGTGFNSKGAFSHPSGSSFGQNVIILGADMSSSVYANNRANNLLVLGKSFTQGINGTTIYAEKMYSHNFTVTRKKLWLSLHYNGDNSYLFVNGTEVRKFKAKDSGIVPNILFLGNISEDFPVSNTKKTGLYGSVFDFSVDYDAITVDDILDIHKCLMKKMA